MKETFEIRRAQKDEGKAVGALWLALWQEQSTLDDRFALAEDASIRWENDFVYWTQDQTRRVLVAEAEGQLVGFLIAQRWAAPPIYQAPDEVYIDELYVLPAFRRKGMGSALVAEVKAWAEGLNASRLRMGVLAANAEGLGFWAGQEARPLYQTLTIALEPKASAEPVSKGRLGF